MNIFQSLTGIFHHPRVGAARHGGYVYAALALAAGLLVVAIRFVAPVLPVFDNGFFMPLAWSIRNGFGMENDWANPIQSAFYSWHGVVHPQIVAALSPGATWFDINIGNALFGALTVMLAVCVAWFLRIGIAATAAITIVMVSVTLNFQARPEMTAAALLFLLMLANIGFPPSGRRWTSGAMTTGLLMGVLAVAQPTFLVLASLGFAMFTLFDLRLSEAPLKRAFLYCAIAIPLGLLAAAGSVTVLYDHDMLALIEGIYRHSQMVSGATSDTPYATYWIASRFLPFAVLALAVALLPLFYGLYIMMKEAKVIFTLLYALAVTLFILCLWNFSFIKSDTYYNAFGCLPTGLLLAAAIAARQKSGRIAALLAIAMLPAATAAIGADILMIWHGLASRQQASIARQGVHDTLQRLIRAGHDVGASRGALAAFERDDKAVMDKIRFENFVDDIIADPRQPLPDYILGLQAQDGHAVPVELKGYRVIENHYQPATAPLMNKPFNLSYALYQKVPD